MKNFSANELMMMHDVSGRGGQVYDQIFLVQMGTPIDVYDQEWYNSKVKEIFNDNRVINNHYLIEDSELLPKVKTSS